MFAMHHLDIFTADDRAAMWVDLRLCRTHLAMATACRIVGAKALHARRLADARSALADFYLRRAKARRENLRRIEAAVGRLDNLLGGAR